MAGFLAALSDGQSVTEAVRQGSAAAAIVVARVACAPAMPTLNEITDFMAHANMRRA
jgi:5-dehydro-2-deoxygluconokinase